MSEFDSDPRFAPFVRTDQYGLWGKAPQSQAEQIRLFLFHLFVFPIKCTLGVLCLIGCHLTCRLASWLPPSLRADMCAWTGKVWCRMALVSFGFNVRWVKAPGGGATSAKACGIVSNHCR